MDEAPNSIPTPSDDAPPARLAGENPADGEAGGALTSPFEPRPADKPLELPNVANRDQLRLATSAIVQQGLTLSQAAEKFGVDPDTLFSWHRTYVNFIGKGMAATSKGTTSTERVEFDLETSRKFDNNWSEMLRLWELERPQLSPLRKRMLASPITRWMFRDEKLDKITVSGAIAVLAFTALAVRGSTSYLGKNSQGTSGDKLTAVAPLDPTDPDSFKGEAQQAILSQIAAALEAFSQLETWQQRLPFIRNPEEMKPLMVNYYKSHPDGPLEQLSLSPQVSFIQREEGVFLLLQGQYKPKAAEFGELEPIIFLAEAQEEEPSFLFDWEVMVNYEPVPWEEFIASKSTTSAKFRLRLAKGDYYNQPFMDSEKYDSYAILPLHRDGIAYGFVEKGTELASRLQANLAKELTQNRAMILELSFPEDAKFENILKIDRIVSDGWLEE